MIWVGRGIALGLLAFVVLGPLANLVLWAAAEQWYFPHKLPVAYGTKFWQQVFKPRGDALVSLMTSIWIALATVGACLALAIPAGYALARLRLPWRSAILLAFLMPQAFPSLQVGPHQIVATYDNTSCAAPSAVYAITTSISSSPIKWLTRGCRA